MHVAATKSPISYCWIWITKSGLKKKATRLDCQCIYSNILFPIVAYQTPLENPEAGLEGCSPIICLHNQVQRHIGDDHRTSSNARWPRLCDQSYILAKALWSTPGQRYAVSQWCNMHALWFSGVSSWWAGLLASVLHGQLMPSSLDRRLRLVMTTRSYS